jgi:hypothetical protein
MSKYRKKPVVIEAVKWTGDPHSIDLFTGNHPTLPSPETAAWYYGPFNSLIIPTLEGDMRAEVGDWIIKGIKGEFYPCKNDIFEQSYELVDD